MEDESRRDGLFALHEGGLRECAWFLYRPGGKVVSPRRIIGGSDIDTKEWEEAQPAKRWSFGTNRV